MVEFNGALGTMPREMSEVRELVAAAASRLAASMSLPDSSFQSLTEVHTSDGTRVVVTVLVPTGKAAFPDTKWLERVLRLSPREAQTALLLTQRMSGKEIARELNIATNTAERYTSKVFDKLGVNSRRHVGNAITAIFAALQTCES